MKFDREAVPNLRPQILTKLVHFGKFSLFYQSVARYTPKNGDTEKTLMIGDIKVDFVVMELKSCI